MHALYPPIKPYAEHQLLVDTPHKVFIEECGNPDGLPIIVLHGGPGSGCDAQMRRFFDPGLYRIILFDQRGCGRSKPHGELEGNTTQALVEDMEQIREHLNIDRWFLFGGSWGATLALIYAQTHPKNVLGMILRGVFLGRISDIEWFYGEGTKLFFPDYWHEFLQPLQSDPKDVIRAYKKKFNSMDELGRLAAAKTWATWEARCSTLQPHTSLIESFTEPFKALSLARIEAHYFSNHCFLEDNQILENIDKLADIPAIIVHGRYDMICPLQSAWDLNQAWSSSELYIVRDAGHASSEPGITDALIHATKKMAKGNKEHA